MSSQANKPSKLTDNLPDFITDYSTDAPSPNQQFLRYLSKHNIVLDTDLLDEIKNSSAATIKTAPISTAPKSAVASKPAPSDETHAAAIERSTGKTKTLPPKLAPQEQIAGFVENFGTFFEGNNEVKGLLELLIQGQGGGLEMASDRGSGSEGGSGSDGGSDGGKEEKEKEKES